MRSINIQQPLVIEASPEVQSRKWVLAYIILQSALVVLQVVAMALPHWFKYCWWNFGIATAHTFTNLSAFYGEYSLEDVHTDACGNKEDYTEAHCPDICENIDNFKAAGGVMLGFGMLSGFFGIILVLVHVIKHYRPAFKFNYIILLGSLQAFFYSSGVLGFYFIAELENLKTHSLGISGSNKPAEMSFEIGMLLAMIASGVAVFLVPLSHFKTNRAFKALN
jgi:hypothetical protein